MVHKNPNQKPRLDLYRAEQRLARFHSLRYDGYRFNLQWVVAHGLSVSWCKTGAKLGTLILTTHEVVL